MKPRLKWDDNIEMDLEEMGWGGMTWIGLTQARDRWRALVIAVMNLWVPQNAGNGVSVVSVGILGIELSYLAPKTQRIAVNLRIKILCFPFPS
jgi:hypothetical protein